MIKWIISDMDGTLLLNEQDLPQDFPQVMADLKKAGIIFSPASGRQLATLENIFADYKEDLIFISDNGTYVCQNGKELFSAGLPKDLVARILKWLEQFPDVHPIVCCKNIAYYNSKHPDLEKELNIYFAANQYVEDFSEVDLSGAIKLSLCSTIKRNAKEEIFEPLMKEFGDEPDIQIVLSGLIWVDVNPAGINKGTAIVKLQEKLGFKPEECMAFGDYLNDLEMMSAVEHSYAMANAIPEIKAVAKYEAPAHYEAGVTKIIKSVLANGKEPVR